MAIFAALKHGINLIRHSLRDVGTGKKRSGEWPRVEKDFLSKHQECEACGGKDRLNVHHVMPFHVEPSLDLDESNLITLCMGLNECHLRIGHSGDFSWWDPDVRKICHELQNKKITLKEAQTISAAKVKKTA